MNNISSLKREVDKFYTGTIYYNYNLKKHTTLKLGGNADYFFIPNDEKELSQLLKILMSYNIQYVVLGKGSNVLFDDKGVRGAVIKLGDGFNSLVANGQIVKAGANNFVPYMVKSLADIGLSGIEHIIGIPASLGGLVAMNGGSNRKSISTRIKKVKVVSRNGNIISLNKSQCNFSYRESRFLNNKEVITNVTLELEKSYPSTIKKELIQILSKRSNKFPRKLNNCGSVFKSQEKYYSKYGPPGKIIEELNLGGYRVGDCYVSDLHNNFFINRGNAKTDDFIQLVKYVRQMIKEVHGIYLDTEVRYINENAKIDFLHKFL